MIKSPEMRAGFAAVAWLALAACAPAGTPLELRLAASAPDVGCGEPVTFTVTLANVSKSQAFDVKPLVLNRQAVSFVLSWRPAGAPADAAEREAIVTRLVPSIVGERPLAAGSLPAGQSVEGKVTLPMVHAGPVRVRARYAGLAATPGLPTLLESAPVSLTVRPGPQGILGARFETDFGAIEARLLPDAAPGTVVNLCDLARTGWFADTEFSRIVKGFVIQGGAKQGQPMASPGWSIPAEFNDTLHEEGTLSMARQSLHIDTGCAEFFICLARNENQRNLDLGGGFPCTAFGRVISGIDVVRTLAARPTGPGADGAMSRPLQPVAIRKVSIFAR